MGPNLVGAVHVHVRAQEGLQRIEDAQLHVVFSDGTLYALIGKRQKTGSVVDGEHARQVSASLDQARLDRVAQAVFRGLVDHAYGLHGFLHAGQQSAVGAGGDDVHHRIGLALAGIAENRGQLAQRKIGIPQPVHHELHHVVQVDHVHGRGRKLAFRLHFAV